MPYDDASYIFFCKPFHQGAHKQIMQKRKKTRNYEKTIYTDQKKIKIGKREREIKRKTN